MVFYLVWFRPYRHRTRISVIRSTPLLAFFWSQPAFFCFFCFFCFFLLSLFASASHQLSPHSVLCTQLVLHSSQFQPQPLNSAPSFANVKCDITFFGNHGHSSWQKSREKTTFAWKTRCCSYTKTSYYRWHCPTLKLFSQWCLIF
jgi:hypothetical protein